MVRQRNWLYFPGGTVEGLLHTFYTEYLDPELNSQTIKTYYSGSSPRAEISGQFNVLTGNPSGSSSSWQPYIGSDGQPRMVLEGFQTDFVGSDQLWTLRLFFVGVGGQDRVFTAQRTFSTPYPSVYGTARLGHYVSVGLGSSGSGQVLDMSLQDHLGQQGAQNATNLAFLLPGVQSQPIPFTAGTIRINLNTITDGSGPVKRAIRAGDNSGSQVTYYDTNGLIVPLDPSGAMMGDGFSPGQMPAWWFDSEGFSSSASTESPGWYTYVHPYIYFPSAAQTTVDGVMTRNVLINEVDLTAGTISFKETIQAQGYFDPAFPGTPENNATARTIYIPPP